MICQIANSVSSSYKIRLKNQAGILVAEIDDWEELQYTNKVNDVGSFSVKVNNGATFVDLFDVDGQVEIWRRLSSWAWHKDFEGFHVAMERNSDNNGAVTFTSDGVSYNDLLRRTIIAYKAGTIRADKNAAAETAIKEYVEENCGTTADDTVVGRLYQGGYPGFSVEDDSGFGPLWTGTSAFQNLLEIVQEIAEFADMDFQIVGTGPATFEFRTYSDQIGEDRTTVGLDPYTGLNGAGNYPAIFSIPLGNTSEINYEMSHNGEANVVVVLGDGELSLQDTVTRTNTAAIAVSPWNRREVTRSANVGDVYDVTNQMNIAGDMALNEMRAKETFEFVPLQQPSQLYGEHYTWGDLITGRDGELIRHRRISEVSITVSGSKEEIKITLSDIPNNEDSS